MSDISSEEWMQITSQLENHHALFYQMWVMGRPIFDDTVPTAAVSFDKNGEYVGFIFNTNFWKNLSLEEKKFIICHEALHVLFQHGSRAKNSSDFKAANVAMDIAVNHSLVNNFGFDRNKLSMQKDMCWVDTVFPGQDISDIESFEYYWNQMPNATGVGSSIDDHSGLNSFDPEIAEKIIDKLNEKLSNEEKQSLNNVIDSAGSGGGGKLLVVDVGKVIKKKKWETVIKEWSKKFKKQNDKLEEQWTRTARRYATLSSDLFLPTEMENDSLTEDKIQVWFFLDCSGSCVHLKGRFFKAAKSLPADRFDVKLYSFDDKVYDIDSGKNRLWGGGGTSFSIIEAHIRKYMKENESDYPKAVFLITDGYGSRVHPQQPENWYWFLSSPYYYYIPEKSNTYLLRDFE